MPTDNPMDMIRVQPDRYGVLSLSCTEHGQIWEQATDVFRYQPAEPSQALADLISQAMAHVREAHRDVSRETSEHPWQEYNEHGNSCHYPGCTKSWEEHPDAARPGVVAVGDVSRETSARRCCATVAGPHSADCLGMG